MSQIQVVRRGEATWELTRVGKVFDGAYEYELIGRVIRDGGFYYVELPQWQDVGYAWHRQPRAYQIAKGAMRALTERDKRAS